MSDDDTDSEQTRAELVERFREHGADEAAAEAAADRAADLLSDYEDADADDLLAAVHAADYEAFERRYDFAVGEVAAGLEDCTDSRAYRLSGFGDLAADPEQGA